MTTQVPALRVDDEGNTFGERVARTILDVVGRIPPTDEHQAKGPHERARALASAAASKAALAAGTLALPPGPLGWLTILPELAAIWRIQRQMVADIAGAYGASADLTRSHMLYCLFRHAAAQAVRDVGVQVGARLLIQDVPLRAIEKIAAKIGVGVSRHLAGRGLARWLPVVGALGVAGYAYYDTAQVARTAIALFGADGEAQPPKRRRGIQKATPTSSIVSP
ncbi:EcsC family protein [Dokdonella sp.]|uniref:EcsC family protein n=1 Tax=Dokdonella sp. TaxID=2291710 RepID=UPI0026148C50|nr:EcsC family protein [Dokdonella sp.]